MSVRLAALSTRQKSYVVDFHKTFVDYISVALVEAGALPPMGRMLQMRPMLQSPPNRQHVLPSTRGLCMAKTIVSTFTKAFAAEHSSKMSANSPLQAFDRTGCFPQTLSSTSFLAH